MVGFLAWFSVLLLVGFGLLVTPFSRVAVDTMTRFEVALSAFLVRLFGGNAVAIQDLLTDPASGLSIQVMDVCNASNVMILLWAATLAYPAPWRDKFIGLFTGTLAIQALNIVRIITLFYLFRYDRGWFEFAHHYLWESALVLATMAVFGLWIQYTYRAVRR